MGLRTECNSKICVKLNTSLENILNLVGRWWCYTVFDERSWCPQDEHGFQSWKQWLKPSRAKEKQQRVFYWCRIIIGEIFWWNTTDNSLHSRYHLFDINSR